MREPLETMAERLHRFYRGKLSVTLKVPISSHKDFGIWYSPGVAGPCREIASDAEKAYNYTLKGNLVAVVTDGSRVLGLGDLGPEASLPVMEGKAILFKFLGDVDAFPICLDAKEPWEIVEAVKSIAPTFGAICLEDVDAPKCFQVLDALNRELGIPVIHDDQQGTAVVVLAALRNGLKLVGKRLDQVHLTHVGAGAAGLAVAKLLIAAGADPAKMVLVDSRGILYPGRPGMDRWKGELAEITNLEGRQGGLAEAIEGSDVVIGLSRPGPGIITRDMVKSMAEDPIVFALANPYPEIDPKEAFEGGARIVATGRSDYPNQVNNALAFPAIFRALLDVRARAVNVQMLLAASETIARYAEEVGLREDFILPTIEDEELCAREAAAVVEAAVKTGVARARVNPEEELISVRGRIKRLRESLELMVKGGFIPCPPAEV